MINSISLEKGRYDDILQLVTGTDLKVVALCMSEKGIPQTVGERLSIAENLINGLVKNSISMGNKYVDPLVQPISTNDEFGVKLLDAVSRSLLNSKGSTRYAAFRISPTDCQSGGFLTRSSP